jgi:hypothetical protein
MIPAERRLPAVRQLIAEKGYFTVHAARQVGKTTFFRSLARSLQDEGRFAALHVSCESAQAAMGDVERGIASLLDAFAQAAFIHLPPELQPPPADSGVGAENRLFDLLRRWCESCPLPVVLFLDEIDSLLDGVLISTLRQLRAGYPERPEHFPISVALIGLRDVRDYRLKAGAVAPTLGSSSPFNIKVESVLMPGFTAAEVAELLGQHEAETGQRFTPAAVEGVYAATRGQPWLVNALARLAVRDLVPDRRVEIGAEVIERAKELLIERRDTHVDSLLERLREPRVRRVIAPILAGEQLSPEVLDDDLLYAEDLGLLERSSSGLAIANPIYREIIPRALTSVLQRDLALPRPNYLDATGGLDWPQLLEDFRAFWLQNAESYLERAPYSEAAAQLVFMAYLQKVVNGGGTIEREYAVGRGRLDLCVRWPAVGPSRQTFAAEIKVWRSGRPDPAAAGLDQLAQYLERLSLDSGTLIVFDQRAEAPPLPQRFERRGVLHGRFRIDLLRL